MLVSKRTKVENMTNDYILEVKGLSKKFGSVQAVNNLDIRVEPGSIYGFLGRNGAGKTTTIRMLMGIISPDKGHISILGDKSKRITRKQKQKIGYVSQENNFYQWMTCKDIGEFVSGFYNTWDKNEYNRLLNTMELPHDRKIGNLSGGMKVKAALAMSLAYRPDLLILDEPTSGLDPAARKEFLQIVAGQAKKYGRTTFFSSHIISEVEEISSHISIIDQGRKNFEGTMAELKDQVRKMVLTDYSGEPENLSNIQQTLSHYLQDDFRNSLDLSQVKFLTPVGYEKKGEILIQTDFTDWAENLSPSARIQPLSLEDIFISITNREKNI